LKQAKLTRIVKPTSGVYFRREDYASFWRRVLVDLIDILVFGIICVILAVPMLTIFPLTTRAVDLTLLACVAVALWYFVYLKRYAFRTLGYRAGRVRIVGLDGMAPGYGALTLRLMFAMLGPLNWVIDLAWLSSDPHRQAIQDKFAATYVVRGTAVLAGSGKIIYRQYDIASYNCLFREVEADLHQAATSTN
jgi:uncharacterized RDD family membrane protein YckC